MTIMTAASRFYVRNFRRFLVHFGCLLIVLARTSDCRRLGGGDIRNILDLSKSSWTVMEFVIA